MSERISRIGPDDNILIVRNPMNRLTLYPFRCPSNLPLNKIGDKKLREAVKERREFGRKMGLNIPLEEEIADTEESCIDRSAEFNCHKCTLFPFILGALGLSGEEIIIVDVLSTDVIKGFLAPALKAMLQKKYQTPEDPNLMNINLN